MSRVARGCRGVAGWRVIAGVGAVGVLTAAFLSTSGDSQAAEKELKGRAAELSLLRARLVETVGRAARRGYGPEQVEGPPDVRQAGDSSQAWASLSADGQKEWLLCEFAEPIEVRAVIVYENFNPGALVRVSAFNAEGDEIVAWEGQDPTPRGKPKGTSVIPLKLDFPVQRIRLAIDSAAVPGWNEIDAVALEDGQGTRHWTTHAEASTTYGAPDPFNNPRNSRPSYSAAQATGEPDTARPGDQGTAWASASPDNQPEWFVCEYKTAEIPAEIVVYENTAPGAITKIGVFKDDDTEVTVWEGTDPTPRDQPWGVSVFPIKTDFPFKKLKLYINSHEVPGYNEIDAVGLRDAGGETQWAAEAQASSSYGMAAEIMAPDPVEPRMAVDRNLKELQKEVQALRKEMEELRKVRSELNELKEQLKDGKK